MLACPVCGAPLTPEATRFGCSGGHHFDRAREGYVNLLLPHQTRRRQQGDDRESVAARSRFLGTDAYRFLADALRRRVAGLQPTSVLDVGCGDGYFTGALARGASVRGPLEITPPEITGIDISRDAVRVAARQHPDLTFAVAGAAALPVLSGSVDCLVAVMAPLFAAEVARVLRPGGHAVIVVPGQRHLEEVRRVLYGPVVRHEIQLPLSAADGFTTVDEEPLRAELLLRGEALADLVTMTPYRWAAPHGWQGRLACRNELRTPAEFVLTVWRRS